MNINEVMEYLPHRYPFLLVDRVDDMVLGERITGRKNVTINEPFFQGHFPGHPVMPGVLIVEALAQLSGILAFKTRDRKPADGYIHYLARIDNVRFRRPVVPGDTLELRSTIAGERQSMMKFETESYVDGELACSAEMSCVEQQVEQQAEQQKAS